MINYPTLKKVDDYKNNKNNFKANQGMGLEEMINKTNEYYLNNNIAFVNKRPTSIKVIKTSNKYTISEAVFEAPSTLDYVGVCDGHYLDFEAKETKNKQGFPLSNIANHQIKAMKAIIKQKGISFAIIYLRMYNEIYLLDANILIDYYDESKRIIPYEDIKSKGTIIKEGYFALVDYIKVVKEKYFKK